jgi:hypothetical protein
MSRIRVFMIEAEVPDGELAAVTAAIQNAFKPALPAVRVPAKPASLPMGTAEPEPEEIEGEFEETVNEAPAPRPKAQRKPAPTPDILDLDLASGTPLAEFAAKHKAESHLKRFLVAAAWYKLHRSIDAVTPAHIYTAYRHLKWPTNVPDFAQPLRDLKAKKYFGQSEKGSYEINHIGLQEVADLSAG